MLQVNFCHQSNIYVSDKLSLKIVANSIEEGSSLQEKTLGERCHSTDSDFQSFLLPLEQDFTKSSKGYSSQIACTADKDLNFGCSKSSFERPGDDNLLMSGNFSEAYSSETLKSNKTAHRISPKARDYESTSKSTVIFSKKYEKNIPNTLMNSDNLHDNNADLSEDCSKIGHPWLFNSKDDDDSSSDKSVKFDEKCAQMNDFQINPDIDTDSDDSIIFSDTCNTKDKRNLFFCNSNSDESALFCKSVNSSVDSDDNWQEDCKESDCIPFFEKYNFELGMNRLPDTSLEEDLNISFSELGIGGYVNACFEDDVFTESAVLRSVNEKWNNSMEDVPDEPHESKRVSFVPLPDLVSVHSFEPDDDGYNYSLYVLDQVRFQNRIEEFKTIIAPYLTPEHRTNVYQRNYLS